MPRLKLKRFKAVEPPPAVRAEYLRVYPSRDLHYQPEALPPLSSQELFGNDRALAFDLGCGRGEFLVARASEEPDLNFVGFDWHWKSIWKAIENAHTASLKNVRLVRADFRLALRLVPDESVAVVYLLFPPPVVEPKRLKNDTLTAESLRAIHRVLKPGAPLHFVTDSPEYFETKLALIDRSGLFDIRTASEQFEGGITRFQRFWENFDITSKRLECRKKH
jgi:tRNA (guanine-N7-)-methyltransferase